MKYPDYRSLHLTGEDGKTTERRENRKGDRIGEEGMRERHRKNSEHKDKMKPSNPNFHQK